MNPSTQRNVAAILVASLLASACATAGGAQPTQAAAPADKVGSVARGGETGLGVTGAETPEVLKAIAAAPYENKPPGDCASLAREIVELDALLGPDVDVLAKSDQDGMAERAIMGAVRGAIPYRWVLRWMTQASRKDRELRLAVLAATARRGYLKGVRQGLACAPPAAPAPA